MKQKDYEKLLTDIVNDIVVAYYNWDKLDKYTLTVIGEDILYIYALVRLGYDYDKALDFSIKQFNKMLEEHTDKEI